MNKSKSINFLDSADYAPERLFDTLIDRQKLRCDAGLARSLGIGAPALSKMRNKKLGITGDVLIRMHDVFGLDLDLLRKISGIPRTPNTKAPEVSNEPEQKAA